MISKLISPNDNHTEKGGEHQQIRKFGAFISTGIIERTIFKDD